MQFHYSNVCPRCQDGVWIWGAAKYVCCLRRGTFVLRRKKGTKERRKKPRFLDFLSAPRTFQVVGVRPTRLMDFAGGMKCRIVSAPAPLPLTAPNAGVYAPNVAGHTGPAAFNRGTPSNRRRGRCPHRPAVRSGCFFRPAQGAASPTPRDRCKCSYISKYERQRRTMADNTAFRPRPTENPANRPELK